jgi:hypothetical protein
MKHTPLIALVVIVLWLIPQVYAVGSFPHEITLDIPCFKPTKITFNYAETTNASLRDIHTLGSGQYTHTGARSYYEFQARDVDTYEFDLDLMYGVPTNQSVSIAVWSGNLPMQSMMQQSIYDLLQIHVVLRVQDQPSFPTQEEVSQAVVASIEKSLQDYYSAMNNLMAQQNQAIVTATAIAGTSIVAMVLIVVIVVVEVRRLRRVAIG